MAHLEEITEAVACSQLSRFLFVDPLGVASVQSVVAGAHCLALVTPHGTVTIALKLLHGSRAWISAAAGLTSAPVASLGLAMLEDWARARGASSIGFQTMRRGLLRSARSRGYQVHVAGAGWYAKKELRHEPLA